MADLPVELRHRIALLASDHESGASEILDEVIRLLRDVLSAGVPIKPVARALCRAQPSMAPVWNAALEALASAQSPERFERFAHRVARAPEALARFAVDCFSNDAPRAPLRLVTLSFSRSVLTVFDEPGSHAHDQRLPAAKAARRSKAGGWRRGWPRPGWPSRTSAMRQSATPSRRRMRCSSALTPWPRSGF